MTEMNRSCLMYRTACGVRLAPGPRALCAVESIPTGTGMLALAVSAQHPRSHIVRAVITFLSFSVQTHIQPIKPFHG